MIIVTVICIGSFYYDIQNNVNFFPASTTYDKEKNPWHKVTFVTDEMKMKEAEQMIYTEYEDKDFVIASVGPLSDTHSPYIAVTLYSQAMGT